MIENIRKHRILILDFGSQYTQLIARRIRELNVYCELQAWSISKAQISTFNPSGIILSGGPENAYKENSPRISQYVFEAGVPVFGICYGMQIMAIQLGGYVETSNKREFGYAKVEIQNDSSIIHGINDSFAENGKPLLNVWMSHGDKVTVIPSDFIAVARTENCPFAIIANEEKHFYGVQFHPEVTHTYKGDSILRRFIYDICKCKALWEPVKIVNDIILHIQKKVGNNKVMLGLSGGIDSSVTAILLHRAIGNKNLICVFVDNGLLCLQEAKKNIDTLNTNYNMNIIYIKGEQRFFEALSGKYDPEIKRKIIGHVFIEIFNEEAIKQKDVKWLAQGTIYPDIIESAVLSIDKTHTIKSHHNVGGLPKNMQMKLLEPLKKLFKDEVRKIGVELGLSYDILHHHPFPGPGLGIRILGEVKKEYCELLRRADAIFIEELRKANLYDKISQAFTVFLPIRSIGIMGDNRKYDWVIALRAVETIDFMTANWVYLPYKLLSRISNRIINEVNGISRVVYDITNKPPATIEWE